MVQVTVQQAFSKCVDFYQSKNFKQSLEIARKILEAEPNHIDSKYIASLCLLEEGDYSVAEKLANECLAFLPNNPDAIFNLANIYNKQGRIADALDLFEKAIEINPNHIGALNNSGNILNEIGKNSQAIKRFEKILEIGSNNALAYSNISLTYKKMGMLEKALEMSLKAVKEGKSDYRIFQNTATICVSLARNKDAIEFYRRAFELAPDNFQLIAEYHEILAKVCCWEERAKLDPILEKLLADQKDVPSKVLTDLQKNADPAQYLRVASEFTNSLVKNILKTHEKFTFSESKKDKNKPKLRIGYMSSDIKDHPVPHLMRGVFKNHDKNKFEVYLYSFSAEDKSGYKKEIAGYCDVFRDVKEISTFDTAQIIKDDDIDILIDLNGHTGNSRPETLALKPAPIQISYIGYIGSMGADFIDYIIADEIVIPKDHQEFYSEKLIYMPNCYQANDNELKISSEDITKESENLPDDKFIFCSFNQTYKIEPVMFDVWMNILKRVKNSVLWLYCGSIYEHDTMAVDNLKKEASKRGIDTDRIIFAKAIKIDKHLKRIGLADLALDTRLYNGGTVTSQTLWAGTPVLTLTGNHYASRMATSILNSIGLNEMISENLQQYEDKAVEYASNSEKIKKLKAKLQKNKKTKPLFGTKLFTRNIERAYTEAWKKYCRGEKPDVIDLKVKN